MPDLSRTARRLVYAAWGLLAVGVIGVVLTSSDGSSPGPTILFVTAGLVAALGAVCAGRAIDAGTVRSRLLWVGRALALVGAAVTIVFPAVLYQEIAMLASQGRQPTYDIEAAMWHEFQLMPLVVVPAFVALRWARLGAALFVLDGMSRRSTYSFSLPSSRPHSCCSEAAPRRTSVVRRRGSREAPISPRGPVTFGTRHVHLPCLPFPRGDHEAMRMPA